LACAIFQILLCLVVEFVTFFLWSRLVERFGISVEQEWVFWTGKYTKQWFRVMVLLFSCGCSSLFCSCFLLVLVLLLLTLLLLFVVESCTNSTHASASSCSFFLFATRMHLS
jgi:hypothetical protein